VHVLLAEDNVVNQQVAVHLLRSFGATVDVVSDGAEAVARCRARPYDLVLMDVQMPVMDGLEATRCLRQLPQWADVPIVAMTANAFEDDRRRCLDAGMNGHVAKPVNPGHLHATLAQWLGVAADERAPAAAVAGAAAEATAARA
jgi:CheY-like chemotaxis protein